MSIQTRVLIRKPDINTDLLAELEKTATDRIRLRIGESIFPTELESIAVEVICAMFNKSYHEGIKSENVDSSFSISFVDDILNEYEKEFVNYLEMKEKSNNVNRGVLRFL